MMGEGRAGLLVSLTVCVLLKVRELFWREFALGFSHFSGSGGCRVQKPFDSTAQRPYTPARHASRCDAPVERDTGGEAGLPHGWQQRWKTMDNRFSKSTVTAIGDDDDRCEVDNNNNRRRPESHSRQSSLHYELIPPHYSISVSSSSSTTNMCYVHGSIVQVTSVCPMCKVFKPSGARYSPVPRQRPAGPASLTTGLHPRCPHVKDVCRNRSVHPRIDVAYLKNAEGKLNLFIDHRPST